MSTENPNTAVVADPVVDHLKPERVQEGATVQAAAVAPAGPFKSGSYRY